MNNISKVESVRPAPGPWSKRSNSHDGSIAITGSYEILMGGYPLVCECPEGDTTDANATLIVQAVNCHGELVESLREICAMFEDSVFIYGTDDQDKVRNWLRRAARVMAKTEGDK